MTEKIIIEMEVTDCFHCRFLNSSDTGEDCNILRYGIQEGEWSNIDFQLETNWRYKNCPLFHKEYLMRNCGIEIVGGKNNE